MLGLLSPTQTLAVPFRPTKAGLVKVIVVATWDGKLPRAGGSGDPQTFDMTVELDLLKPGGTIAANKTATKLVGNDPHRNLGRPRIVLWVDAPATAADLAADWTARILNTGDATFSCEVTVRYQTVDGNLGKIDHIVVLMMENRSFDHMLGYLRLERHRVDVDGLTGGESNKDDAGLSHAVQNRTDSYFRNDPEHGLDHVREQLTWPAHAMVTNTGFVHDFAGKLLRDSAGLPPKLITLSDQGQIDGGDTRDIGFRPGAPGRISFAFKTDRTISRSDTGNLASVELRRPDKSSALLVTIRIGNRASGLLQYNATVNDLALAGDWTWTVLNATETSAVFTSTITYVQEAHDLSLQEQPDAIMGYYDGNQLPAYDVLATGFHVCDRWFASAPTDTFPNRLFALTGGSGGLDETPSSAQVKQDPPAYTAKTIFEVLQERGVDWRIFFHDLPFALVFKRFAQDAQFTNRIRAIFNGAASDLEHLTETGDLPSLAWIDPNFSDFRESAAAASDDHPPGDVSHGQRLVAQIYNMLSASPAWTKTLLIITYDEHGGFYDHVAPPDLPGDDPDQRFQRYGVRVPALIVSPWVQQGSASHEVRDHASLLSTILHRFAPEAASGMGLRVARALDLAPELSLAAPRVDVPKMPDIVPPVVPVATRAVDSFGDALRHTIFPF
jgi:phospholipase C